MAGPDFLFLKDIERFETAEDPAVATIWGDGTKEISQSSYIRNATDAATEATRQQALTGQVLARDTVRLHGTWLDLEGEVVGITKDRLGYDEGRRFLVLGSEIDFDAGTTVLEGIVAL